jgi:hypothetical protein
MIPTGSILELQKLDVERPENIKLDTLQNLFKKPQANGQSVTRLIFVENEIFRYVLHVGTFNAFIVESSKSPSDLTFAQLVADQEIHRQISKLLVFVSAATTLADAKNALDGVPGAQDIIVTATGNASAPMLGWLTNVDLIKALTAS